MSFEMFATYDENDLVLLLDVVKDESTIFQTYDIFVIYTFGWFSMSCTFVLSGVFGEWRFGYCIFLSYHSSES